MLTLIHLKKVKNGVVIKVINIGGHPFVKQKQRVINI